jgi:FkbM family methyltransferase
MKLLIKNFLNHFSKLIVDLISLSKLTSFFFDKIIFWAINKKIKIKHNNLVLNFMAPNNLCLWRAKTFASKEPETLKWIDDFKTDSVFWDIGANIGLYSIYAAMKNHKTYSFEPSFLNLETLSKNIYLNKLQNMVTIFPIALNDISKLSLLNMSNTIWGGAHSTFDKKTGWNGKEMIINLQYRTLSFKPDELIDFFHLAYPNYIKIDVDGIENLILKGSKKIISHVLSILVEVTKNNESEFQDIKSILEEAKFVLKNEIKISEFSYNQIWISSVNS